MKDIIAFCAFFIYGSVRNGLILYKTIMICQDIFLIIRLHDLAGFGEIFATMSGLKVWKKRFWNGMTGGTGFIH